MAESRVPAIIDALLAKTSVLANYRLPSGIGQAINYTTVWDGPEWTSSDDYAYGAQLVIGWPGTVDQRQASAESVLSAGPIASTVHPRDEDVLVSCMALYQQADTPKIARDAVYQVLADVATLCRADPSLGLNTADTIGGVRTLAFVTAGQLSQYNERGYVAQLPFAVTIGARV